MAGVITSLRTAKELEKHFGTTSKRVQDAEPEPLFETKIPKGYGLHKPRSKKYWRRYEDERVVISYHVFGEEPSYVSFKYPIGG